MKETKVYFAEHKNDKIPITKFEIPFISEKELIDLVAIDEVFNVSPRLIAKTGIPLDTIITGYNQQGYDVKAVYLDDRLMCVQCFLVV